MFPRLETKKEVRSFLGLTVYYNKYIRNYSRIAVPLTDAIKKKMPNNVVWTEECESLFQAVKLSLIVIGVGRMDIMAINASRTSQNPSMKYRMKTTFKWHFWEKSSLLPAPSGR